MPMSEARLQAGANRGGGGGGGWGGAWGGWGGGWGGGGVGVWEYRQRESRLSVLNSRSAGVRVPNRMRSFDSSLPLESRLVRIGSSKFQNKEGRRRAVDHPELTCAPARGKVMT